MAKETALTEKQRRFCHEYVKHFNGSKAYLDAGYKSKNPDVLAAQLLGNTRVQKYIETIKKATYYRPNAADREKIYENMMAIAFVDETKLSEKILSTLKASDVLAANKWLWEIHKQPPLLETMSALAADGLLLDEQVEALGSGIESIRQKLRGIKVEKNSDGSLD